ncbi:MAG: hypothetical protein MUF38_15065 [Anaerolineae bacterium]|jgi:hypothetical protein|nr:hypothetical protein [Anaerolineae bacterium]
MIIETTAREATRTQRFAHYFTLIYCALALFIGANLRDSALYAITPYTNSEVGITAFYPESWLFDTTPGVVLDVRDTQRAGFNTRINIRVLPFSPGMSVRNLIDTLALQRRIDLPFYKILSVSERAFGLDDITTIVDYTFVSDLDDPFLQLIPAVVIGEDVFIVRRNQVILVSFTADANTFDRDYAIFERFLETLDY